MPPLPGEERLLTVFADIHYYFSAPTPKPRHHRFDKGSYLYIYYSATQRKTRLEVANNPGSQVQDAFNGALDRSHLRHSTKFPTLCTLTVNGIQTQDPNPNPYEWNLPCGDESNPESFRLHTLDIYFWTENDASQFLDLIERHLSPSQIETDRHPFPPPPQSMSNVVQQLENVAISDPAYQNGQTRNSLSEPTTTASIPSATATPQSIPATTPAVGAVNNNPTESAPTPAPLPYNPAAPAAPEPIQHREKTPPPPMDGPGGTGLAAAAVADTPASFGAVPGAPSYGAMPPGPPGPPGPRPQSVTHQSMTYSMPGSYASPPPSAGLPPPSAGLTHSGSFPPSIQSPGFPPSTTTTAPPAGVPSYTPSFLSGGSSTPGPPQSMMSFAPPPKDPNAHLYGQQPQQQQQHQQQSYNPYGQMHQQTMQPTSPPPPIGGYSNYSYESTSKPQQTGIGDYSMHNQLYRPTEAEAGSYHQKYAQAAMQNPRSRGLEDKAHRVENKVNSFLKRLEKKI